MQKTNIRIVVQSQNETAKEFAERLESICYDLTIEHKDKVNMPPMLFMTSTSSGRQTATIQFITREIGKIFNESE